MESLFPELNLSPKQVCKVDYASTGRSNIVPWGTLLIEAARDAMLDVPQQCGGLAICSWCKMEIVIGAQNLSELTDGEERLREWGKLSESERASCQAEIHGDVTVAARYW